MFDAFNVDSMLYVCRFLGVPVPVYALGTELDATHVYTATSDPGNTFPQRLALYVLSF